MRLLVLSDTHAPRHWKGVPEALRAPLATCEVILHAGDVCTVEVLDELSAYAPLHAVQGNNDGPDVAAWGAPEAATLVLDGLRVAMIHDSGQRQGRGQRMRQRFPGAELVVFGHSHIPMDVVQDGVHLFNPGSPTDRRRQPHGTYGELVIDDGRLVSSQIIEIR